MRNALRRKLRRTRRVVLSKATRRVHKCKTEYENALLTLKSLDAYCRRERERLDASGKALDAAVANMCMSTGSTRRAAEEIRMTYRDILARASA